MIVLLVIIPVSMIPLCCASREFALVDSPWLNGISSPQFPQAWPVVGRVNGFVCARTGIRHYEYVQSRLWSSSTCSRQKNHKKELMARPCRRWASSTNCNSVSGSNSQLPALLWKRRHADSEIGRGEFPLASKTVLLSRQNENEGWLLPKAQRKKLCGDIVWAVAQVHQVAGLETPPYSQERRMNVQRVADWNIPNCILPCCWGTGIAHR